MIVEDPDLLMCNVPFCFLEHRGPPDVPDHSACCSLPLPVHLHTSVHRVGFQADAAPLLSPHMGLSGHNGVPVYVLWRDTQPLGPGE